MEDLLRTSRPASGTEQIVLRAVVLGQCGEVPATASKPSYLVDDLLALASIQSFTALPGPPASH